MVIGSTNHLPVTIFHIAQRNTLFSLLHSSAEKTSVFAVLMSYIATIALSFKFQIY